MKKLRLTALALALCMLLATVPAMGYNAASLLPQRKTYSAPFADAKGAWCAAAVQTVYEAGLMEGKSAKQFDISGQLTCAQIVAITARLHDLLHGGTGAGFGIPAADEEWYQPYLSYLEQLYYDETAGEYDDLWYALMDVEWMMDQPCYRYQFVALLHAVLPDIALTAINRITALPDVADESVLDFYNAGILTGMNQYGTFQGWECLNRGQAAAMLARLVDPAQRVRFTPADFSFAQSLLGLEPQSVVATIDGYDVTAERLAACIAVQISYMEWEASTAYYETYSQYLEEYYDDANFYNYDTFADYLLAVYHIDALAESTLQWDVPDKAGLTPGAKVLSDTLDALTEVAVLFSHADRYALTAEQKALVESRTDESMPDYFGFSRDYARAEQTAILLGENMAKVFAPAGFASINDALYQSGLFYGRSITVEYADDDPESWAPPRDEALSQINAARSAAAAHLADADYFSYLAWKYGSDSDTEPSLIYVDALSDGDRQTLKNLPVGALSNVMEISVEETDATYGYHAFTIFCKDDPTQNQDLIQELGSIPAQAQLAVWAHSAKVVLSEAYTALSVAQVAARYDTLSKMGLTTY